MPTLTNKSILLLGSDTPIGELLSREIKSRKPKYLFLHHTFQKPAISESAKIKHIQANVKSEIQIKNLIDSIQKETHKVDIVINANNLYFETEDVLSRTALIKTFQANVFGWIEVCRQILAAYPRAEMSLIQLQSTNKDQLAYNLSQKTSQDFMDQIAKMNPQISTLTIQYRSTVKKQALSQQIVDNIVKDSSKSQVIDLK